LSGELRISREDFVKRGVKILLGVPMFGAKCEGIFCRSAMDLAVVTSQFGVPLQLYFLFNESLITRARNYIADEFMRSDCTHLMFIDSDIGFSSQDVLALAALATDDSPYDIISGVYPKKTISWEKIKTAVDKGFADEDPNNLANFVGDFVFNPLPGVAQIPINQPVEVLETGTGFMMIRRSAFEKVKANRPDLSYRPDHVRTDAFDGTREIMAYFMDPIDRTNYEAIFRDCLAQIEKGLMTIQEASELASTALKTPETLSKRLLSEDYFFSQEVRKAGGKVWICPWIKLEHVGAYTFGGSLANLAQAGVAATADPEALKRKK
jgi:hypothetical protein